jgi:predicted homoserine dehydrogenase-like protein
MVGAGFMGRGVVLQVATKVPGLRILAVANRHIDQAERAYKEAGFAETYPVETPQALAKVIARGEPAVTEDWRLLTESPDIEAILETTGSIEYSAQVAMSAIENGKHFITMSAEMDGTVGPILKRYADRAGVVFTGVDGDQPGVTLNLYRFVCGIGVRPVVCGNIKGLHDPYRNPTTQEGFAKKWGQKPSMVTSFADGTKVSFEQGIIANATGMRVARRGMLGPTVPSGTPIDIAAKELQAERFIDGPGIVDYVTGAVPGPGVFVLGTIEHPQQRHYLNLYKLGEGPLYCFYTPYHLCHFEVPNTIARAVLFNDAAIAPLGGPCVEVIAAAKTDLKAGDVLDDLGCYMTYGLAENADVVARDKLLPHGIGPGCRLKRDIPKDQALTYADVELPAGRLVDRLRAEQEQAFAPAPLATAIAG